MAVKEETLATADLTRIYALLSRQPTTGPAQTPVSSNQRASTCAPRPKVGRLDPVQTCATIRTLFLA